VDEIRGKLLWLSEERYSDAMERIDDFEQVPKLFRRIRISADRQGILEEAYAYEWIDWREYWTAAGNKIKIARYHRDLLSELLPEQEPSGFVAHPNSIPIQAQLEGILFSFVSAAYMTLDAMNFGLRLNLSEVNRERWKQVHERTDEPLLMRFSQWQKAPISNDIWDLRNRVTHHFLVKERLEVQRPGSVRPYAGRRYLPDYSRAAIKHLDELEGILNDLDARLDEGRERSQE
jgi:hypothetical protein